MTSTEQNEKSFEIPKSVDNQWCPGCGNFSILHIVKKSLKDVDWSPQDTVFVSGIGQAAKFPQYSGANYFNGLHGRPIPVATGIKASNPNLNVIITSGDGDTYGEGGDHFMHVIRRNPNITLIVHNNMIYGLTKGQASPTSEIGLHTPTQPEGVYTEPMNPIAMAISLGAPFVARASAGNPKHAQDIITQAFEFEGLSIVDIFQPCPVFNKINTYQWFNEHTYVLDETYNPSDKVNAFEKSLQTDKFPLGIIYKDESRITFENAIGTYSENEEPLYKRKVDFSVINDLLNERK